MEKVLDALRLQQTSIEPSIAPCGKPCTEMDAVKRHFVHSDQMLASIPVLIARIESMDEKIGEMVVKIEKTGEIVSAWGNIRGFGKTMAFLSDFLRMAAPIVLFFGAIYLFFINPQVALERVRLWLLSK